MVVSSKSVLLDETIDPFMMFLSIMSFVGHEYAMPTRVRVDEDSDANLITEEAPF